MYYSSQDMAHSSLNKGNFPPSKGLRQPRHQSPLPKQTRPPFSIWFCSLQKVYIPRGMPSFCLRLLLPCDSYCHHFKGDNEESKCILKFRKRFSQLTCTNVKQKYMFIWVELLYAPWFPYSWPDSFISKLPTGIHIFQMYSFIVQL